MAIDTRLSSAIFLVTLWGASDGKINSSNSCGVYVAESWRGDPSWTLGGREVVR